MFKLFTQSRWARARAYADAGRPPPTITLEGKNLFRFYYSYGSCQCLYCLFSDEQLDLEKAELHHRGSAGSGLLANREASPSPGGGGGHISQAGSNYSSRRGSGNNNSCSISNQGSASQSRRNSNRSSGENSLKSRRTSFQKSNGALISSGNFKLKYVT